MSWKKQLLSKLLEDEVPVKKPKTPLRVKVAKGVLGTAGVASLIGGGLAVHKLKNISTAIPEFGKALKAEFVGTGEFRRSDSPAKGEPMKLPEKKPKTKEIK